MGHHFTCLASMRFFSARREGLRSRSKYESRGAFANAHQIRDGLFGIHFGGNAQEPAEAFLDHVIAIVEEDVRELKRFRKECTLLSALNERDARCPAMPAIG